MMKARSSHQDSMHNTSDPFAVSTLMFGTTFSNITKACTSHHISMYNLSFHLLINIMKAGTSSAHQHYESWHTTSRIHSQHQGPVSTFSANICNSFLAP